MSGFIYTDLDGAEPVSDTFGMQAANAGLYSVILPQGGSCALTYSVANMTVDIAAGMIMFYGVPTAVPVAAAGFTLVSSSLGPRWTWLALSSTGTPVVVSGDPAAQPSVPELGDRVAVALVYVQANLTVAANATYRLDKRVPTPGGSILIAEYNTETTIHTTSTATDMVTLSGLSIPTLAAFRIEHNYRKAGTSANNVRFGLKLNSTVVLNAAGGAGVNTSATMQAEDGAAVYTVAPRSSASYLTGLYGAFAGHVSSTGAVAAPYTGTNQILALSAALPNAAITSITITGDNDTADNSASVFAVRVYLDL